MEKRECWRIISKIQKFSLKIKSKSEEFDKEDEIELERFETKVCTRELNSATRVFSDAKIKEELLRPEK